jgi:UDP-N-acetylmuramoyl-L-alanyl-D-glutamate--2,6-diaminopimelate ligase
MTQASPRGAGIALDALFPAARRSGPAGVHVAGCTADWRRVQPGDAFVAVTTDDRDGHEDARRAVRRGASAVLCERPVPVFHVPQYEVDDSREAWCTLSHALAGNPSERLRVVGICGAHGKSTVAALLESIFVAADVETGVLTDAKSYDGMSRGSGIGPAPSPETLAARLARMEAAGCTHAIVELSSRGLSQRRFSGLRLDALCVTHVTSASLEFHQSPQNYRDAERRATDLLAPEGVAVLNGDDPVCQSWISDLDGPLLAYGLDGENPLTARILQQNAAETIFLLRAGDETAAVRTTIVGTHHVENCLAAAAVALWYGIDLAVIARGIEAVSRLTSRMERVACGQDFPVFVDAASSADAVRASLMTARRLASGRVLCVLSDAPPASSQEAAALRQVVRKLADVAVVTDARLELEPAWTADDGSLEVHRTTDRVEAIAWAVSLASRGDVVVVTGSRSREGFGFGAAAASLSDADVAREILYARENSALRLVA